MQAPFTTLRQFKTANFVVALRYSFDDDVDTSFDDTGETADKIASGEWTAFFFEVVVLDADGRTIGADALGGSIYADPREFMDHRVCGRENRRLAASPPLEPRAVVGLTLPK